MIDIAKAVRVCHWGVSNGAEEWQEDTLVISQGQVPVATGLLKSSGGTVWNRQQLIGNIYYDTDYAVPVHEDLGDKHPTGKAKFLEDPMNFMASKLIPYYLAPHLTRALKIP